VRLHGDGRHIQVQPNLIVSQARHAMEKKYISRLGWKFGDGLN
jgi:hypothetical protein